MEVVASFSQGRTAAAQCGLFTHKSVPVIFEPPCTKNTVVMVLVLRIILKMETEISSETVTSSDNNTRHHTQMTED